MPVTLTEEQTAFAGAIAEFARREVPDKAALDRLTVEGPHSDEVYRKIADLGWLGISLPEEYGGADGSMTDLLVFLEETSYHRLPIGGFGTTIITAAAIQKFGSEEQKRTLLGGTSRGDVLAISMSEPGAGSDVGGLTCKATKTEDGWLIEGQKTWCSNAHIASHILLVARTSTEGGKHDGLTMFVVPTDVAGLEIRGIETMGGKEVNDLYFTNCHLPADAVVGTEGQGWRQLMAGLNLERMILAGLMLGLARRAFDDTLAYVKERQQFGRPVGSFQAMRHRIADNATELAATKLLVHDTAATIDANPTALFPQEASMAKLKATELAKHLSLEGMQMLGGYGYATEYGMERLLRLSVVSTVYGGTSEIQRDIIGKTLGL
ncbi:acyl-CoA dehydrogenase [Actinomycetospora corticicola]|uniref:Alkylation response protein AidB-like acyl-CoA dehydrogenase n=1 Tax=Actinomycetospora corticicola TaxID=663602 RepID=A0A7Y9J6N4_9PSEU|nr:acyl-CoA dehydrogenase family protein [Actinomycetospora corticicola]NYD37176.1 alkylation response protein AidB-like acyl-CoA dehydrogenase [Actinomycetospora corticicola]